MFVQRELGRDKLVANGEWSWYHNVLSGAAGGLAQSPFANGMEHVKVRVIVTLSLLSA